MHKFSSSLFVYLFEGISKVAESDFTQLLAESEAAESEAQTAYDKLVQENAVTRATKEADAKGKGSEVKNLEVAIGNYKEDKASTGSPRRGGASAWTGETARSSN